MCFIEGKLERFSWQNVVFVALARLLNQPLHAMCMTAHLKAAAWRIPTVLKLAFWEAGKVLRGLHHSGARLISGDLSNFG